MATVNKIDSNIVGLRYAEEESLGVLPSTPVWNPLEPNSFSDFGGEIVTVARNPINPSRQRKKGVTTDLSASGGINTDITQNNLQDIMQGYMFADLRAKASQDVTSTTLGNLNVASEAGFLVNHMVLVDGMDASANDGLKVLDTVASGVLGTVPAMADETPSGSPTVKVVGVVGATGDIDIDASSGLPAMTSTVLDFTTLGLIIGEWVRLGGDETISQFTNAANLGFSRIRTIAANRVSFDKTEQTMVTETAAAKEIKIFTGSVLKNELGTLIKRRSYQLERTLGAPDDALPSQVQSEYITGAVPNEFTLNMPSADKVTVDMTFVGTNVEQRTGAVGVKSGTRPTLVDSDMFNTSSDFARIKLAKIIDGDSAPEDLFAFAEEMTLTISNGIEPDKALGVLGAFDVSAGTFEVGGSMTAYFADITATQAVRDNDDLTIDVHMVKQNAGITFDIPLFALGDGRPNVEQDSSIKLPLNMDAATASKIDTNLDYTLLWMFWDYLPSAA